MTTEAIYFVIGFVVVIVGFIFLVATIARKTYEKVPSNVYKIIEGVIIFGIIFGVFSIFQPWIKELYTYGFTILLVSTILFIIWSHVTPKPLEKADIERMIKKGET